MTMSTAMGLGGMLMGIAIGLGGVEMGIAMGLRGVVMGKAMGLRCMAMAIVVELDWGVANGLAGVRGQTRRITTVLANGSVGTGGPRQNGLTFVGIRTDRSGGGT